VKPERVDLEGVAGVEELLRRVLQARLGEVRKLADGLERRDQQGLHHFRIACKRLRYALERFESIEPTLAPLAECLARLQDALGGAHDRDILLAILPAEMARTERRLRDQREACVDRASELWLQAQESARACPLIIFE
jgi:CHAD domain-containing protein